jgi:hypothetical protein
MRKTMYFNASSLAGFEIIILALVQITAGNIYQMTSLVLAVAMAGLAAGSVKNYRISGKLTPAFICFTSAVFFVIVAFLTDHLLLINNSRLASIILLLILFVPSFLTGALFRKLTYNDSEGSYSQAVYSSDLAGSATGFIMTAGLLIPLLGIKFALLLLAVLNLSAFLFGLKPDKY